MSNLEQSSEEIWKDIEGYEGYYQVSDFGRVDGAHRHHKGYFFIRSAKEVLTTH